MNETNPQPTEELAPLDSFEQQWVDQLNQREPDLVQSEDAFVQSVMQQHAQTTASPAVIGRIGRAVLPYAVAAAVLLAGFVGWAVLNDALTDDTDIAQDQNDSPQPDEGLVVDTPDRPKVEVGKLIANATASGNPANDLTTTVSDMNENLSVDRLFDLLGDSVPDLKEILAPLEPENEQSRA